MYYDDYNREPIGRGNPYHRCMYCDRSSPEANGSLERHGYGCFYAKTKRAGLDYTKAYSSLVHGTDYEEEAGASEGSDYSDGSDEDRAQDAVQCVGRILARQ